MTPAEIYAVKTSVPAESISELAGSNAQAKVRAKGAAVGYAEETICAFAADGDHVHDSTYNGVLYASGHGYWWNYTCPADYRANTTIYLLEKLGTSWYVQGNPGKKLNANPGKGSVNRANAKVECVNTETHKWKSQIVATIVGHDSTSPVAETDAQEIPCY